MKLILPEWADLHAHFRQGPVMPALLKAHKQMGCYAILAMPNTRPPVAKVLDSQPGDCWSIKAYLSMLREAGGDVFSDIIVPLYITRDTTPRMIEEGAKSGLLRAAKYYPPHGTTNSDHGIPMLELLKTDVLKALADNNVVLCIHGEQHGVAGEEWFGRHGNAEEKFYREVMPRVLDHGAGLKISCEHITTKIAADFVKAAPARVAASITPQHLTYTAGDLLQGWYAHLRCMPLVKFDEDVKALRNAVIDANNTKFFAGTDSAPHPKHAKAMDCGCAAGCYVGGIAPQLYAGAFELGGCDLSAPQGQNAFKKFLCDIGPDFHGMKRGEKTFALVREPQEVRSLIAETGEIVPLPVGLLPDGDNRVAILKWKIAA